MMFGRNPAVHNRRTFGSGLVLARHLDKLGSPPPASNPYYRAVEAVVGSDWRMLGNGPDPGNPPGAPDGAGDCTDADTGHAVMQRTANTGQILIPTTQQVFDLYTARTNFNQQTGANDNGDNETDLCKYLMDVGFLGHKLDDTAMVDPQNLDHVRWCIQLFGHCRLGVNCPQSFIDQFNAGQAIRDIGDTNIVGGHDILLVHYEGDTFYPVTWAKRVGMEAGFELNADYVEEAHAELAFDWVQAQGTAPNGLDLNQLDADLKGIAA